MKNPIFAAWLISIFLSNCSHYFVSEEELPKGEDGKNISENVKASAESIDKWVHGKLSDDEKKELTENCQKRPDENIFCHAILKSDVFEKKRQTKEAIPEFVPPKPLEPIQVTLKNGKIQNWKAVKKADVKAIVKGFQTMSINDLKRFVQPTLKARGCPNSVGPALAASLEDHLSEVTLRDVAVLYEKGADCLRSTNPEDYAHFMTRAGLLYYKAKKYKVAALYFTKASRVNSTTAFRALYWESHCHLKLGQKALAKRALDQLESHYPFSFHALVAAYENEKDLLPSALKPSKKQWFQKRSKKKTALNTLIEEAEILLKLGYEDSAYLFGDWAWDEATKAEMDVRLYLLALVSPKHRIELVQDYLARQPELISRPFIEFYFPKPFFASFEKNEAKLDPFLLLSVGRQESKLDAHALSIANARGIMQINLETAKRLASKDVDLYDPDVNIRIGSLYIGELAERYDNDMVSMFAAYNAGEDRVASWKSRFDSQEKMLFIDLITFRETRQYVASVLRNYYWYLRLYKTTEEANQFLAKLIPKVEPVEDNENTPTIETPTKNQSN